MLNTELINLHSNISVYAYLCLLFLRLFSLHLEFVRFFYVSFAWFWFVHFLYICFAYAWSLSTSSLFTLPILGVCLLLLHLLCLCLVCLLHLRLFCLCLYLVYPLPVPTLFSHCISTVSLFFKFYNINFNQGYLCWVRS